MFGELLYCLSRRPWAPVKITFICNYLHAVLLVTNYCNFAGIKPCYYIGLQN